MIRWCCTLRVLVGKELRLEWRGKELVTLLLCNASLFAVLVGAGVSSALLDSGTIQKIFSMLLWVVFMLSTTTAVSRFNEQELEGRGFEGLLLAGVTGTQMYLAKWMVMTLYFFLSFSLLLSVLSISLNVTVMPTLVALVVVGFCTSSCLASLLSLLAAVASTSRLKGVLLPIISLPILFPVFISGMEMTTELVLHGALSEGAPWPVILVCAHTVYLLAGINLFEIAVRD